MATYQTRHLEATREIAHGDKFLKPGDTFEASETDAEHYLRKGHAKAVTAPEPAPAPKAVPAKPSPAPAKAPARAAAAKKPVDAEKAQAFPESTTDTRTVADVDRQIKADNARIPTPDGVTVQPWERTEPLLTKLADVPHPDTADTPPKE